MADDAAGKELVRHLLDMVLRMSFLSPCCSKQQVLACSSIAGSSNDSILRRCGLIPMW